ncbi:MAG: hypothetical protein ACTHN0_06025 [Aquihabitans sp.]
MSHKAIYATVIGVFAALLVVMMVTFDYDKQNREADRKADQLIALYEKRGLPAPADKDQIARVLGDDAAVVCKPLGNGVDLGTLKTRLGVGGEFYFRSTRVDAKALIGLESIVQVYCPDELDDIHDFLDGFKLEDDLIDANTN